MKYMLIDITAPETTRVLLVAPLTEVQLHGKLVQGKGRQVVAPPLEARGFAKLDKLSLQYLYWNTCQETPPEEYGELVQKCLAKIETFPVDPSTVIALEAEVARSCPQLLTPVDQEKKPLISKPIRPAGTTTTGLVWEIADRLFVENGNQMPARKLIMEACLAEEINPATAATQYSRWKRLKEGSE